MGEDYWRNISRWKVEGLLKKLIKEKWVRRDGWREDVKGWIEEWIKTELWERMNKGKDE